MMKGDPVPIIVKAGTKPYAAHTPIQVPLHWEEQVKSDQDCDVGGGAYQHAHHLVCQDGGGPQIEWLATEDSGPPTP